LVKDEAFISEAAYDSYFLALKIALDGSYSILSVTFIVCCCLAPDLEYDDLREPMDFLLDDC
jgi:hypothetical protein